MISLDEVYGWFNWHTDFDSFLSVPVGRLINHMKNALKEDNLEKTEHYIGLSIEVSQMLGNSLEIAEVNFECAYAYCLMQEYQRSISLFRQAINLFDTYNVHNRAVASWMLGHVFWQLDQPTDAIVMWERSCRIFQDLKSSSISSDWYAQVSIKVFQALKVEIDRKTG
jgi:tetratricopeptide (TPR) repeat protein